MAPGKYFCLRTVLVASLLVSIGCGNTRTHPEDNQESITVAAAANLTDVFDEIGKAFHRKVGVRVVYSYGATTQLAQQVEHAAPFDVFAAADTEHIDDLVRKGSIRAESRAVYARGALALWLPNGESLGVRALADLARPDIRFVAIATPGAAPYGKAAIETLKASGLWQKIEPKIVYANNVSMAKQFAASGNADAAFTAYSIVFKDRGTIIRIDETLHAPLDQALGILTSSKKIADAREFVRFVLGKDSQLILRRYGYTPR
jgi:molybdate transport system substrate-binding protein